MRFLFHERAEAEFDRAVQFYEECRRGLGMEFAEEVYAAIARITRYPEAWSSISKSTRRCLVNRFPFGVIYHLKPDRAIIIAVADLLRQPDYWLDRE